MWARQPHARHGPRPARASADPRGALVEVELVERALLLEHLPRDVRASRDQVVGLALAQRGAVAAEGKRAELQQDKERRSRAEELAQAQQPATWSRGAWDRKVGGDLGRACWRRTRLPTGQGCAPGCAGARHAPR